MSEQSAPSIRIQRRLHSLLTGLWIRRNLVVVPMLIMPIIGAIVGVSGSKTYVTNTSILIQEPALFNPFLEDLAVATNLEDRMPGLRALVHSRHVLTAVGIELGALKPGDSSDAVERYVSRLGYNLDVDLIGTDLVRIYYRDTHPDGMKQVLETVTDHLIQKIVAPEKSSLSGSADFLRDQLDQRHKDLIVSEQKLATYKSENSDKLPELHAANIAEANRLKRNLVEKQTELAGAQALLSASRKKLSQTNPMLGQLEKTIMDLRAQLAQTQASYTDEHSQVRGLKRRLEHMIAERTRIIADTKPLSTDDLDRLWNMLSSPKLSEEPSQQSFLYLQLESLHLAAQKEQSLTQELKAIETFMAETREKIKAYGSTEMDITELNRDLEAKQKIYGDLLHRWELAQVTRALGEFEAGERIKIIDRAFTPGSPIDYPWYVFALVGVFGGLFAGLGLAFVLEVTDTRIKRRDEVMDLTGLPVIARIPSIA